MTNMFKPPAAPPPPTVIPPPTMPDPNSPDALAARRLAMAQANTGGRSSTILTTQAGAGGFSRASGTLAGSTYSAAKTGSG